MKKLSNFFYFRKRFWVPGLFILFMLSTWIIVPFLMQSILGAVAQFAYVGIFMAFQVFVWFGVFFYYLAGRIRQTKIMPGDLDLVWDDYRGQPQVVQKAHAWVDYLKGQKEFEEMGGEYEPGILMLGPPGSGKTYLAKVMASEAGVPFVSVEANSLLGTFIGIGPLKVSRIFSNCRNLATEYGSCILFIDEIDAIGGARAGMDPRGFQGWLKQTFAMPMMGGMGGAILNTILSEIDGFTEKRSRIWRLKRKFARWFGFQDPKWTVPKVMVIGSTNRPDILDPALVRSGRLGRKLLVDLPNIEGLRDIAQYYLDEIKHDDYVTAERVSLMMAGRTPSDVRQVLRKGAVQLATIEGADKVYYRHFQQALAETTMGDKQPLPLSEKERVCLAYHEAGHAIVLLTVGGDRLKPVFLTTERYGRALGHMFPVEAVQWQIGRTQSMIEAAVCIFMAGMVAEEVFLGERHDSVGGDGQAIRSLVNQLEHTLMLGTSFFHSEPKRRKAKEQKYADLLEVTREILEQNRAAEEALVKALMEKKELTEPQILEAVGDLIVRE
jgi:cell division protease FtsH